MFGVSKRTKAQVGAGAEVSDGFAGESEFCVESGCVLLRREGLSGATARGAGSEPTDDFFEPVEFEKLFCWTRHQGPAESMVEGLIVA